MAIKLPLTERMLSLADPNHPTRWKHRRRLTYLAMSSMLVVTGVMLTPWVPESRVTALADVLGWFYFAMASIVGAYMGFATWATKGTSTSAA